MLEGLRGEDSIAELCRKEGGAQSLYYTWSKEFMDVDRRGRNLYAETHTTNRACSATMGHPMSRASLPIGSTNKACATRAGNRIIR